MRAGSCFEATGVSDLPDHMFSGSSFGLSLAAGHVLRVWVSLPCKGQSTRKVFENRSARTCAKQKQMEATAQNSKLFFSGAGPRGYFAKLIEQHWRWLARLSGVVELLCERGGCVVIPFGRRVQQTCLLSRQTLFKRVVKSDLHHLVKHATLKKSIF